MSNYFQVLKRIEQDRTLRVAAAEAAAAPQRDVETLEEAAPTPTTSGADPVIAPAATAALVPPPAPMSTAPVNPATPAAHVTPVAAPPPPASPAAPTTAGAARPLRAVHSTSSSAHPAPSAASPRPAAPMELKPPVRPSTPPLSAEGQRGIATLFDNIRALASGRATRVLVFAGAAGTDSVYGVTEGLARHAQRHGMTAFIAELARMDGGPTLVSRMPSPPRPLSIDLDGGGALDELNAWVNDASGDSDLVLLEAPPLADSIDAALLACACDGLVIVADTEVTPRSALQIAAERAQVAGCRTLGVVMNGTKERLPSWMRRLFGMDGGA